MPQLQRHPDPSHHIRAVPHEHDARPRRPATSARGCCILGPPPGTIDGNALLRQAFSSSGASQLSRRSGHFGSIPEAAFGRHDAIAPARCQRPRLALIVA